MRIFGGEMIQGVMNKLNMPDNVPLEHPWVANSIQNAQTKVEGFYFDQRKHVVEYDDVMNKQREIIYDLRKKILSAQTKTNVIASSRSNPDLDQPEITLQEVKEEEKKIESNKIETPSRALRDEILEKLYKEIDLIIGVETESGYKEDDYIRITDEIGKMIPFDDASRNQLMTELQNHKDSEKISTYLKDVIEGVYLTREQQFGQDAIGQMERAVYLSTLDDLWVNHLDQMTALRDGIGLRAYGQRDPLVEYKREAFSYFQRLLTNIDYEVVHRIFRVLPQNADQLLMQNAYKNIYELGPDQNASSSSSDLGSPNQSSNQENAIGSSQNNLVTRQSENNSEWKLAFNQAVNQSGSETIKNEIKIGRNDPCWCGSGKKYKKCHFPQLPPAK